MPLPHFGRPHHASTLPHRDPSISGLRVLVVDDEPAVTSAVAAVLRRAGCEPQEADSGAQALDMIRSEADHLDLLVTDVVMPKMSGQALAEHARDYVPGLKVLYITGHQANLFSHRVLLRTDESYLAKPFRPALLIEAVSILWSGNVPPTTAAND